VVRDEFFKSRKKEKNSMEQVQLQATLRNKEETGKSMAVKLRAKGFVPAVVYKAAEETLSITINEKDFLKAMHTSAGANVLIELLISGDTADKKHSRTVIIKEIQQHPYKDNVLHVDFYQIALDEVIKVKVPIVTKGEAVGTKTGGIVERIMWEVEIECLPTQIPEKLEIDISSMEVGHHKIINDIAVPSGVKILAEPEQIVVAVEAKKAVEEVVAVPEGAPDEPEVIREKKLTDEEAAEEAPAAEEKKPKEDKKPKEEKK